LSDTDANGVAGINAEASAGEDRAVQKDISTVVKCHEAETFLGVEPFDTATRDRCRWRHCLTLLVRAIEAGGSENLFLLVAPLGRAARLIEKCHCSRC
jgi:hypothetical protein